jgi:hypothetical protein
MSLITIPKPLCKLERKKKKEGKIKKGKASSKAPKQ